MYVYCRSDVLHLHIIYNVNSLKFDADAQKVTVHQVKEKFVYLVKTHFLQRCPGVTTDTEEDNDSDNAERDLYTIPAVDLECEYMFITCSRLSISTAKVCINVITNDIQKWRIDCALLLYALNCISINLCTNWKCTNLLNRKFHRLLFFGKILLFLCTLAGSLSLKILYFNRIWMHYMSEVHFSINDLYL